MIIRPQTIVTDDECLSGLMAAGKNWARADDAVMDNSVAGVHHGWPVIQAACTRIDSAAATRMHAVSPLQTGRNASDVLRDLLTRGCFRFKGVPVDFGGQRQRHRHDPIEISVLLGRYQRVVDSKSG